MDNAINIRSSKESSEIILRHPFLKQGYLEFCFTLPICLHLQKENEFEVSIPGRDFPFVVVSEEVIRKESPFGTAKSAEITSDTEGGFRLTQLSIIFEDKNQSIPEEKIRDVYGKDVIRAINRFLEIYRYTTQRFAIQNIVDLDSLMYLGITRYNGAGKPVKFALSITFGKGGFLSGYQPLLDGAKIEEIDRLSKNFNSIAIEDLFFMDVKRHYFMGRDLEALILAVATLEITVNKKDIHINYSIKERFLKFLFKNNLYRALLKRKVEKLLSRTPGVSENLLSSVQSAIKERDAVVHGGRRSLKGNLEKHIDSLEKAIKYIIVLP
jgi:hypothetical protein